MDGKNYAIEKDLARTVSLAIEFKENAKIEEIKNSLETVRRELTKRIEVLTNGHNLFVAIEDCKIMKKQADKRMMRLEELEVKVAALTSGVEKMEE